MLRPAKQHEATRNPNWDTMGTPYGFPENLHECRHVLAQMHKRQALVINELLFFKD